MGKAKPQLHSGYGDVEHVVFAVATDSYPRVGVVEAEGPVGGWLKEKHAHGRCGPVAPMASHPCTLE